MGRIGDFVSGCLWLAAFAFANSGWSSLRPPDADRAAGEAQQQQEQARNELALENCPAGKAVFTAYGLSLLGCFIYDITR